MDFWSALKKRTRPSFKAFLLTVGSTVAFFGLLLLLRGVTHPLLISAWGWAPTLLLPVIAVITGVSLIRAKVKHIDDTLPLADPDEEDVSVPPQGEPAWQVMLTVTLAIVFRLVAYSLLIIPLAVFVVANSIGVANLLDLLPIPSVDWFARLLSGAYVAIFVGSVAIALSAVTGYLLSRFSIWSPRLLAGWLMVMLVWAQLRVVELIGQLFPWLPPLRISNVASVGDMFIFTENAFDNGPYIATVLVIIGMFMLAVFSLNGLKRGFSGQRMLESGRLAPRDDDEDEDARYQDAIMVVGEDGETIEPSKQRSTRYGKRPARLPDLRERLLIIMFAVSALFLYDVFAHGPQFVRDIDTVFTRPVNTVEQAQGFHLDLPFLSKNGETHSDATGIRRLVVESKGEIDIIGGSNTSTIDVAYVVRAYAATAQNAQMLYNDIDVQLEKDGDTAYLRLPVPDAGETQFLRAAFFVALPDNIDVLLLADDSVIHLHEVHADIELQASNAMFHASHVQGALTVEGADTHTMVVNSAGTVDVTMTDGVLQVHGHQGDVYVNGNGSGMHAGDIDGDVHVNIQRGMAILRQIRGTVDVEAVKARVELISAADTLTVAGVESPLVLLEIAGDTTVTSDRGNVYLGVAPGTEWNVQFEQDKKGKADVRTPIGDGAGGRRLAVRTTNADIIIP